MNRAQLNYTAKSNKWVQTNLIIGYVHSQREIERKRERERERFWKNTRGIQVRPSVLVASGSSDAWAVQVSNSYISRRFSVSTPERGPRHLAAVVFHTVTSLSSDRLCSNGVCSGSTGAKCYVPSCSGPPTSSLSSFQQSLSLFLSIMPLFLPLTNPSLSLSFFSPFYCSPPFLLENWFTNWCLIKACRLAVFSA